MDRPRDYHIKSVEERQIPYHLHVESKKCYKWTYLQQKQTHTENKFMVTKGQRDGEG